MELLTKKRGLKTAFIEAITKKQSLHLIWNNLKLVRQFNLNVCCYFCIRRSVTKLFVRAIGISFLDWPAEVQKHGCLMVPVLSLSVTVGVTDNWEALKKYYMCSSTNKSSFHLKKWKFQFFSALITQKLIQLINKSKIRCLEILTYHIT